MQDIKDRVIEALLTTMSYDDMTKKQMDLIVEYELSIWTSKVDEYLTNHNKTETEQMIHDLWLNYDIADKTEDELLRYIGSDLMITI